MTNKCLYLKGSGEIQIFKPSRGIGGTLAYPIKILEERFTFEMDDEGEWRPFPLIDYLPEPTLLEIERNLDILEKKRLNVECCFST